MHRFHDATLGGTISLADEWPLTLSGSPVELFLFVWNRSRTALTIEVEFRIADDTQAEMLRLLLKRFIIKCTRLARVQLLDARAGAAAARRVLRTWL